MPLIPPNPINANTYLAPATVIPGELLITAISQSYPMQVTFINTSVNTYIPGQNVRLVIPTVYGMQQAHGLTGTITAVNNVSFIFSLDIDSTNFDPFWYPGTYVFGNVPLVVKFNEGSIYMTSLVGLPSTASVVPGSVNVGLKGNFYTDPALDGVLVGSAGGTGTINYSNGFIQVSPFNAGLSNGTIFGFSYTISFLGKIQPASMCPSGSKNLQFSNLTSQVAFQNLDNVGN